MHAAGEGEDFLDGCLDHSLRGSAGCWAKTAQPRMAEAVRPHDVERVPKHGDGGFDRSGGSDAAVIDVRQPGAQWHVLPYRVAAVPPPLSCGD